MSSMEAGATAGAGVVKAERDVPAEGVRAIERAGFAVEEIDSHDDGAGHGQLVRKVPGVGGPELTAATDPRADGAAVAG